jgi:hypothetical protein
MELPGIEVIPDDRRIHLLTLVVAWAAEAQSALMSTAAKKSPAAR